MPTSSGSLLFSSALGKTWIEKILPPVWEELCTDFGVGAGVVVLKSWEEDSFYESASFGYEEEGFYYSFLARGEAGWNRVKNQTSPTHFSGRDVSLFLDSGYATVVAIRSGKNRDFVGFLLVETETEAIPGLESFLYLLAEKIGKEREEIIPEKRPAFVNVVTQSSGSQAPLVVRLLPNLKEKLEIFSHTKILSILGPSGSGKKTLAKYIHQQIAPTKACLFLSAIPEHLGKLEKALVHWSDETGAGTLVFLEPKKWSLGQQKIIMDWVLSDANSCHILFVNSHQENLEILPGFGKLLQKNFLQIPGLSYLERPQLEAILLEFFSDLSREQNRNGMELDPLALESLLSRNYPHHFTDLKNILLSGILKTRGNRILESELESDVSRLNLGVPDAEDLDLRSGIQALERQKILNAMRIFSGNQIRMAKALGISRGALQNKMKQLGLF